MFTSFELESVPRDHFPYKLGLPDFISACFIVRIFIKLTHSSPFVRNLVSLRMFVDIEVKSKSPCYFVDWNTAYNTLSFGSPYYFDVNSSKDCLDWCLTDATCVGVDVNTTAQPQQCWPHFDINDFNANNLYTGWGGIDDYRLTCANINVPVGR